METFEVSVTPAWKKKVVDPSPILTLERFKGTTSLAFKDLLVDRSSTKGLGIKNSNDCTVTIPLSSFYTEHYLPAVCIIREETERRKSLIGGGLGFPVHRSSVTGNSFSDVSNVSFDEKTEENRFINKVHSSQESPTFVKGQTPWKSVQFKDSSEFTNNSDV